MPISEISHYNSLLLDLKELLGGLADDIQEIKSALNNFITQHNSMVMDLGETLGPDYATDYIIQNIDPQARITK